MGAGSKEPVGIANELDSWNFCDLAGNVTESIHRVD
jgi:hypothetical protein